MKKNLLYLTAALAMLAAVSCTGNENTESREVVMVTFMGQSNMAGRGIVTAEHPEDAPEMIEGAGYEFRAVTDPARLYPITKLFGKEENREGGIHDEDRKTGSMVPAFVNAFYKQAGIPVIAVSASKGGTEIRSWLLGDRSGKLADALSRIDSASEWITDNGYSIQHNYVVWCQGETDADNGTTREQYKERFHKMAAELMSHGVEKIFVVRIGEYNGDDPKLDYGEIMEAQNELCKESPDYVMATTILASFKEDGMMKDAFHYFQDAYNKAGTLAGCNVAYYLLKGAEPVMYDPRHKDLFFTRFSY